VVEAAREAFGPAPVTFPGEILIQSPESIESADPSA
jgi:hypothetical protein